VSRASSRSRSRERDDGEIELTPVGEGEGSAWDVEVMEGASRSAERSSMQRRTSGQSEVLAAQVELREAHGEYVRKDKTEREEERRRREEERNETLAEMQLRLRKEHEEERRGWHDELVRLQEEQEKLRVANAKQQQQNVTMLQLFQQQIAKNNEDKERAQRDSELQRELLTQQQEQHAIQQRHQEQLQEQLRVTLALHRLVGQQQKEQEEFLSKTGKFELTEEQKQLRGKHELLLTHVNVHQKQLQAQMTSNKSKFASVVAEVSARMSVRTAGSSTVSRGATPTQGLGLVQRLRQLGSAPASPVSGLSNRGSDSSDKGGVDANAARPQDKTEPSDQ